MMRRRSKHERAWFKAGPVLGRPVSDWRYQRPSVRTEKCCLCGWCLLYCPTGCIRQEGGQMRRNMDFCKGCGLCAKECPVSAIFMVAEGGV
jgi:2-oxoacid:acceptor oxidoreductase delta subunit (pyruvate/2-ketoisovalerate family)